MFSFCNQVARSKVVAASKLLISMTARSNLASIVRYHLTSEGILNVSYDDKRHNFDSLTCNMSLTCKKLKILFGSPNVDNAQSSPTTKMALRVRFSKFTGNFVHFGTGFVESNGRIFWK